MLVRERESFSDFRWNINLCGINSSENVYHTLLLELIKMFSNGVTLYKMAGGWGRGESTIICCEVLLE